MMAMSHPAGVVPILATQGIPVTGYPGVHLVPADHVAHVSTAAAVAQAQGEAAAHSVAQFTGQAITSVQLQEAEAALENDKKAIYKHPLFPLLALLFEKCEKATQTPECPTADGFNVDIQAFVQQQERDNKPFFSDDSELDNLMVKSIQVLRIHLLELEKVNELCKDFCNRYIACLKGKLQSENILRTESSSGDSFDDSFDSPHQGLSHGSPGVSSGVTTVGGSTVVLQNAGGVQQAAVALNPGQIVSGGTVYQMVQTPQGIVAQPIQIQTAVQPQVASVIHGSTPLSQIGVPTVSTPVSRTQTVTSPHPSTPSMPLSPSEDEDSAKKKAKRGVLPKQATQVMKSWLFQHIVHPYPTEDEKRQIAGQTNLTLLQVNNWFINARRRILQPMLDASNPEGSKAKKNKPQNNRPVQRFWPDSIANLQPQPQQVSSLQQQQQQQQQQTSAGSTAGPTPGTITVVPYFSPDGQLISTQAVTLEALQTSALQTSHVNPMLSEAQPTGANSPTLMVQNGEQDEKDNEEEGALQSSDLGMENSDDDSDLVGDD